MALETDTSLFKIGDGVRSWNALPYGGIQGTSRLEQSKQMISGDMADILSNLYLAQCLVWYHNNHTDVPLEIRDYCINRLCSEAEYKLNRVIMNYPNPYIRALLTPSICKLNYDNFEHANRIFELILSNDAIDTQLKENVFYENTVIEDLEKLTALKRADNKAEYDILYEKVIQVGETKI